MDALTAEKNEMSAKLEMLYKIEPVNETMYTIADADIYDDLYGEALGNEPTGNIPAEQEIKITGKSVAVDWYEIEMDGKKQYISGSLLSTTKPSGNTGNTSNTQPSSGGNGGSGGGQPSNGEDAGSIGMGEADGMFSGLPEFGAGGQGSGTGEDVYFE